MVQNSDKNKTLLWFRGKDLRLSDHQPLQRALQGDVLPVFVLDPFFFAPAKARQIPNRMQFLLESLQELQKSISDRGSRLLFFAGKSVEVIPMLAARWEVSRVVAQRWTEPFGRRRDERIARALQVPFVLYEGETLAAPGAVKTLQGNDYSVFTPFYKRFMSSVEIAPPLAAPERLPALPAVSLEGEVEAPTLSSLGITHNPALLSGGEGAARQRLQRFIEGAAPRYPTDRDRMDLPGTSRLSADLKFGTLSVRELWSAALGHEKFLQEIVWREFAHSLLWRAPTLLQKPFRADFEGFPWRKDERGWAAWVEGKTGYPVVDAASRQLLTEGFVHNRARMISASFLTKHLMISYQEGEAHYLKQLTDGDWAQNNMGWQWSAGCGCDAQPYFRVFHPVSQGERFDPDGQYVRRYVPELERLPTKYIHAPWEAPAEVLRAAGVSLGQSYPRPIVEHSFARERFLTCAKRHLGRNKQSEGSQEVL